MNSHVSGGTVAIIPARGGSKRISRKNVKLFAGRPMISYSIAVAKESGVFDRILVSTDDDEIALVARECGAEVPFKRPAELADDHTPTDAVILHAVGWLEANGFAARYLCCIYATAPFLQARYVREGLELLKEKKATSAFSVTTFPYTIFRSLMINERGRVEMFWPENYLKRSQDLPEAYHDAGQFYWADAEKYLLEKRLFSANAVPVVLPRCLVQDVDTPEDWEIAERMFQSLGRAP